MRKRKPPSTERSCKEPKRLPASIELTENLDAGGTRADYGLGDSNEEPMFDDAGDCGQMLRQSIWAGNGAEEAIHDVVPIVAYESLPLGVLRKRTLALAAAGPRRGKHHAFCYFEAEHIDLDRQRVFAEHRDGF